MRTITGSYFVAALVVCMGVSLEATAQRSVLEELEDAFVDLSATMRPSVVEIASEGPAPEQPGNMNELFRFFGQPVPEPNNGERPPTPPPSTGSGFIYDRYGHIVTNNHVVRDAETITVELWNGEKRLAEVIGQDRDTDLAVIKIDPVGLDLAPVTLGTAEKLRVGQFAIAMGSPSGFTGSFSYGHITGLGRDLGPGRLDPELRFQNFIQTDAAINLGNSGGPLCNIHGEVIGVNVAIVYRANSIGFAIPIDRVRKVVPELVATGTISYGWLGVSIFDIEQAAIESRQEVEAFIEAHDLPDQSGSFVDRLSPDGPADRAGFETDDVIREIDGDTIDNSTDLINTVSEIEPGTVATVSLWRKGRAMNLDVVVGEFPGRMTAQFGRPLLGMHVNELTEEVTAQLRLEEAPADYYIANVVEDSPADEAGVKAGDVIIEVANKDTTTLEDLKRVMSAEAKPGKTVLLRVVELDRSDEGKDAVRKIYLNVPEDFTLN